MRFRKMAVILSCSLLVLCSCGQKEVEIGSATDTDVSETIMKPVVTQPADELVTDTANSAEEEKQNDESAEGLVQAVNKVTSEVEWAALDRITDNEIAQEFFKLNLENPEYKDIVIMQCPMSAVLAEMIIIETDNVDGAKADLEARKDKLINVDAFYPNAVEIAENSIVGTYNNIVYFIAAENAEASEEILRAELEKMGY
ncbi:MAG: DUF4358 domain-containing protein [Oscillospiraceae bacterium]